MREGMGMIFFIDTIPSILCVNAGSRFLGRMPTVYFAVMTALLLGACYSYQEIAVERKYRLGRNGAGEGAAVARVQAGRIFARISSSTPLAAINNRAVDLCAGGHFGQAEILFREVLAEDRGEPAGYNNAGIICEINGNRDEAFRMYDEACRLDPRNPYFRHNFQTFADSRQDGGAGR
jgi:hypothetical protein